MYTTAHRVQRGESEGINRFLHLHGEDFCWPKDASSLPEAAPGEEKRAEVELLPGGNRVRSYLDVLAPDSTSRALVSWVLTVFGEDLNERLNPTVFRLEGVTIRFGVDFSMLDRRGEEFGALAEAVRELLAERD